MAKLVLPDHVREIMDRLDLPEPDWFIPSHGGVWASGSEADWPTADSQTASTAASS